ncbi:hypothetical protein [Myceligenerans salitolerans]|uniref:Uncharacterized protein n=1 Tax=Myceligenerans salitolerans TaxID=1230528 RepID=A0ABS3I8Z4_9MICO|nr:hypothetical protein [Myceligenerans salitolerans]MBO0609457.1 hypothetical protein [Myceligenerans salitolerans]
MEERDDDATASSRAQENLDRIAARLEALVEQRDPGAKGAMSDPADGATDGFRAKEHRWNAAADEVRSIIRLMHQALDEPDAPQKGALNKAKPTADGIG